MYLYAALLLFLIAPLGAQEAAPAVMASATSVPSGSVAPAHEVPRVTINGRPIVTLSEQKAGAVIEALPAVLRNEGAQQALANRAQLQFYRHNPVQGQPTAPLAYAEFTDLSCLQCMPLLAEVDAALVSFTNVLRKVHVTLPVDKFGGTNLAAFYGKVAQEKGLFWDYRRAVIALKDPTPDAYTGILLDLGLNPSEVRQQVLRNSRRFYRELDADLRLSQRLRQERPPAIFLNGIPLGGSWIPLEQTGILAEYEQQRALR